MPILQKAIRHRQVTELLVILTKAEDNVKNNRVAPIKDTFDDLLSMLRKKLIGDIKRVQVN